MSRLLRLSVLGLVTVAFSGVSSVAVADQVSGAGTNLDGVQFTVSALSGPSGENPRGTITFSFPSGESGRARVVCVGVLGEPPTLFGAVSAEVVSANPPFPYVHFLGVDFGPRGNDEADLFGATDPNCPSVTGEKQSLARGNLVIRH